MQNLCRRNIKKKPVKGAKEPLYSIWMVDRKIPSLFRSRLLHMINFLRYIIKQINQEAKGWLAFQQNIPATKQKKKKKLRNAAGSVVQA
jgi:hypothetical protein